MSTERTFSDPANHPYDDGVAQAVERLATATRAATPCKPVRDLIGSGDIPRAYAVQQQLIGSALEAGDRRAGRKIGLTSDAVQRQLGVDQPDFGTLLESMSVPLGAQVAAGRLLQPRIEAEIAFLLEHDIDDPDPTLELVAAAVAVARPALEVVDSRIAGWDITIADTIADNASSGLFVLGDAEARLDSFDPVAVQMRLLQDGSEVASGTGAACLDNPLIALQWLARAAAGLGEPLRAGEVILSGALGPMVPVIPGSRYEATISGLGNVHAQFAAANDTLGAHS